MENKNIPYKIYLSEDEMPKTWYNVRADMSHKPAPLVNPGTGAPMGFEDLRPVFCDELIAPHPWSGPTAWRKSCRPLRKSTISSRATTPLAPTS